ncbi:Trk K+ transport system NAD-binding subunit [Rhodopseudomonas thermotolerans]|uniref:Trk K+ transport system NAD-binding subunit n=2 Tax=Rhodopseudomonas TaxID=1073 RepID=A0A336K4F3_9BRAD|nr:MULTISPECIES: potassium channel protein [Rhodopseudomonas]RED26057.1 Trk K+ transport system NAD-binding subunit [Rhodopseudomonas pentothenatexigens]REF91018.1 Trk K+ transport system NAD-binding subunit [Rhodopseudomonas thermotolerans]SSW92981.1 Trk K+ transport system NAD-binding subunit [Rhodopseudomonas pentothenatexigens]
MRSIVRLGLSRLRPPLILLALVFAVSTLGLMLIPGVDAQGHPWRMTLFDAFYFVTYTATTIGFGELPHPFTDQQRGFVTVIIYLSVIGWAWLLGSLLSLVQEKAFQQALVDRRFRRAVAGLDQPFYLVCGLGDTGMTVVHALRQLGCRLIAIDKDERAVQQLEIEGLNGKAPALIADARSPETLTAAGLMKAECKGVLTLCNDDEVNLAVAIAASILRPGLTVIGRADSQATAASMSSLGTHRVINPFREFAEHLTLAMRAPDVYRLTAWLTSSPGANLFPSAPARMPAAPGHWIVCGYGRFGREVVAAVQRGGFTAAVIDPVGSRTEGHHAVHGRGADIAALREAGIAQASGIVAGTDDDAENLAIAIAARRLKPDIFLIARQNLRASHMLFAKLGADITMVPSEIIAHQCLAALRTPLLADFLDAARRSDEFWAFTLSERLRAALGNDTPQFWSAVLDAENAPKLIGADGALKQPLSVAELCVDPEHQDAAHPLRRRAIVLRLIRGGSTIETPADDVVLQPGDTLLCVGSAAARATQQRRLGGR